MSGAGLNDNGSLRAWFGNGVALSMLLALAVAFGRWQAEPWWVASPRAGGWVLAVVVVLAFVGLCAATWRRARQDRADADDADTPGDDAMLLAWASQTGFGQQLAEHTAQALRDAGTAGPVLPLHRHDADVPRSHRRALVIASTTGAGDPPAHAPPFTRHDLGPSLALAGLENARLA